MKILLPLGLLLALAACGRGFGDEDTHRAARSDEAGFFSELPAHFPQPPVPTDNPLSAAKVELGRHLFYDTRLSGNGTQSCASCHQQSRAFTDGRVTAQGSTGQDHPRNSQTLSNVAYNITFAWGNPDLRGLEQQNLTPITNTSPIVELGVNEANRAEVLARFSNDAAYRELFSAAFPGESDSFDLEHVVRAIASFNRILLSYRSPFDRYEAGDESALSDSAKRGMALFNSDRLDCSQCHSGFNFSDSTFISGDETPKFHNTGLYNVVSLNGASNYPNGNQGVYEITGDPADRGMMRAPTLRNVTLTAPYNHDGSTATLSDVIDNYARGGRLVMTPLKDAGDGRYNRLKDGEIHGFTLTEQEKTDLLAFLDSLTDQAFVSDPRLADPFVQ